MLPITYEPFARRGITEATARKWGIGIAEDRGERVCVFVCRDAHGVEVAQKIRRAGKKFSLVGAANKRVLWGQHLWGDTRGRHVVVTEGEWDAASISQAQDHRWPVVSVPDGAAAARKAIAAHREWLLQWPEVILAFDADEPGRKAAIECAEVLPPGRCRIVRWPEGFKDASDLLQAGRTKDIINALWEARPYRPDGIVVGKDAWDLVGKLEQAPGVAYPWELLQARTHGLRRQEILTLTAGSGIGKSALCRELAAYLLQQGEKVGYIALEESVRRSVLGVLGVLVNRPLHLEASVDLEATEALFKEHVGDRVAFYDHFGSTDSETLLNRVRYMADALGCSWIVLDHLSIVVSGQETDDERRAIDVTMTQLRSLVQSTGIGLILVCHLKRPAGVSFEEGARPTLAHLRGSQAIPQLSDMVLGLQRDQQAAGEDKNVTRLWVLKNRYSGDTGDAGYLRYDPESGRLISYDPETSEDTDF